METLTESSLLQIMTQVKEYLPELLIDGDMVSWELYTLIQADRELREIFKNA